ncbi:endoplasmic reticulum resident protein 29 [Galendromus occidentalis]|uniref:Endoplasmic reticulum resident protein 29 n=1 Tax=Galendromus occidentalis TaxID=34638 RepID=A0AAJ6QNJ6_9ACAR|nr:endoplasmic reticulum resident protein 29 [Galendromus occidentalis]
MILARTFPSILLLCSIRSGQAGYAKGSIQLDMSTFKKIIPHFPCAIVKVDKDYPHGRNQTQFEKLVGLLSQDKHTIVAEIGVQEFGEKENTDLAEFLNVPRKEHWPVLFIFARDTMSWAAKYQGFFSLNRLRNFVNQNSEVQWSCPACILELDRLVKAHLFDRTLLAEQMVLQTKIFIASLPRTDKRSTTADYYLKLMERILDLGQPAVAKESQRVVRLLQMKLPKAKKVLLKERVDILYYSFGGNLWSFQEEEIADGSAQDERDEL